MQPLEEALASSANKRTIDDLFGDINDIDFDNIELPSKRQKTEEESDMELINKIIESKKLKQILMEPSKVQICNRSNYNIKDNISYNIPRLVFFLYHSNVRCVGFTQLSCPKWNEMIMCTSEILA